MYYLIYHINELKGKKMVLSFDSEKNLTNFNNYLRLKNKFLAEFKIRSEPLLLC